MFFFFFLWCFEDLCCELELCEYSKVIGFGLAKSLTHVLNKFLVCSRMLTQKQTLLWPSFVWNIFFDHGRNHHREKQHMCREDPACTQSRNPLTVSTISLFLVGFLLLFLSSCCICKTMSPSGVKAAKNA